MSSRELLVLMVVSSPLESPTSCWASGGLTSRWWWTPGKLPRLDPSYPTAGTRPGIPAVKAQVQFPPVSPAVSAVPEPGSEKSSGLFSLQDTEGSRAPTCPTSPPSQAQAEAEQDVGWLPQVGREDSRAPTGPTCLRHPGTLEQSVTCSSAATR